MPPSPRRNDGGRSPRNDRDDRSRNHRCRSPLRREPSPPRYNDGPRSGSSWRAVNDRRGDDRQNDLFERRNPPSFGRGDSYRPRPPQSDFTFRVDKPAGIQDVPLPRFGGGGGDRRPRGTNRSGRGRGRGGRWQPHPHLSERALLSSAINNLADEQLFDSQTSAKFRPIQDLSDGDEQDMDLESQSSDSDTVKPSRKRARETITNGNESGDAAPKWSNPDPYTAVPCPDESLAKKKDVVALIRKARVDAEKEIAPLAEAQDFISFDTSSDEESEEIDELPPPPSPRESPPPLPVSPLPTGNARTLGFDALPPREPVRDYSGPLGSRKRNHRDEIKPPEYDQLKKVNMRPSKGMVVRAWQVKKDGEEPCPWAMVDHSNTPNVAFRLHKEVIDFYEYVRPRKFEQQIRDNLVDNLRRAMVRDGRNFASAEVLPFGSFMSGLYLPTADMDLVVCSASFLRGGPAVYLSARSWLYKFQKFLVSQRIAEPDAIVVIAHARIPLVKFVDKVTGLKVDVSFENLGGVKAIDTFMRWKDQYPAMPILVTLIKQFLLMRGLNEPVNGGIGGFSVICLVVSMLQLMPQVQSRNLIPEHHLGEMLLEFFELYGRQFRYENNAISLSGRIGYIRKSEVEDFTYKTTDRLSIIDPNNPSNDISGGSSNTPSIMERFEDAYLALRDRMKEVGRSHSKGSILSVIMAGDYSSFRSQRDYLRYIHEKSIGPCND